ncbi:12638_t:CDS:2 [Cetraspora pellucida]|uniref:12638_t:CDS:1 n=1 Tax=Cetraspora pellucida TaxID=1433469 RepID=A0ACA9M2H8_9GLOM|nr:12638_t:CDS:2 [Cetraspora pellucida]
MSESDSDTDVKLIVGNGSKTKEFSAHSTVLRSRSLYFQRALSERWKDPKHGLFIITKPNIQPDIFESILNYIYTGKNICLTSGENSLNILVASDELELLDLAECAQKRLINKFSPWLFSNIVKNPFSIFDSVDLHLLDELALKCLLESDDLELEEIKIWNCLIKWGISKLMDENITNWSDENINEWSDDHFNALKETISHCIPLIRYNYIPKYYINKQIKCYQLDSNTFVKSKTPPRSMENEGDVQEIFPTTLPDDCVLKDSAEKISQQSVKSGLDRLSMETLKMMCKGEGLPETGAKKELVERLAMRIISKAKGKGVENSNQCKDTWDEKSGNVLDILTREKDERRSDINDGSFGVQECVIPDLQYMALEKSLEKTVQATMEKVVGEFKRNVQELQQDEGDKYWPKEKLGKARDQFEYDEWCKAGRFLDNALRSRNWDLIIKARDVVATRAFMLRVASKEGWNIAAGIRDPLDDDPMEAYFQERLANARQVAKNKQPRLGNKPEMGTTFTGWSTGGGNAPLNQPMQWPPFQPVQQFGFNPSVGPYNNVGSEQGPYQRWYRSQDDPWNRSGVNQSGFRMNAQERKVRNLEIVCFICEEKGHIAWNCPQKRSGQPFRGTNTDGAKS